MKAEYLYQAFENCLQHIQAGGSLEEALALYPEWANELRLELEAALQLHELGSSIQPPSGGMARSRAQFLTAAHSLQGDGRSHSDGSFFAFLLPLRFGLVPLILLLALFFGAMGTFVVSAQALPGDTLYPVKLTTERTRLMLARQPAQRLELQKSFDRERLEEIQHLQEQALTRHVDFTGGLVNTQRALWQVDGLSVKITSETEIETGVQPGYHIEVSGLLLPDGSIQADHVRLRRLMFTGVLQLVEDNMWKIDGIRVHIPAALSLAVQFEPGAHVNLEVVQRNDESLEAISVQMIGGPSSLSQDETAPVLLPEPIEDTSTAVSPTSAPTKTQEDNEARDKTETAVPENENETEETRDSDEEREESETPEPTEAEREDETKESEDEEQKTREPTEDPEDEHHPEPTEDESDGDHSGSGGDHEEDKTPDPEEHDSGANSVVEY